MINVNKYKLDDDSNEEDNNSVSEAFKGKNDFRENSNILRNNNFEKRENRNTNKKQYDNFGEIERERNNENNSNNHKLYKNKNYKYLVDDSTSKINNENDDVPSKLMNRNDKDNINNNFLFQSVNEENNFELSNNAEKNQNLFNKNIQLNTELMRLNNQNAMNLSKDEQSEIVGNYEPHKDNYNYKINGPKNTENFQSEENQNNDIDFLKNSNFHHVQIIDEDVENFKRKIDILVKNFKTDSLKDFMSIKRHLLIEQKNTIESEKQKCDALLGAKTDQIEHLNDSLQKTKTALNQEIEIKEKLSLYFYKYRNKKTNQQLKKNIFEGIKNFYLRKKNNKKVNLILFINS